MHECVQTKEIERLFEADKVHSQAIDKKVNWVIFWSIVTLIFAMASAVVNNTYNNVEAHKAQSDKRFVALENRTTETLVAQAKIDAQYVEIQKQLAEIKLALNKIK